MPLCVVIADVNGVVRCRHSVLQGAARRGRGRHPRDEFLGRVVSGTVAIGGSGENGTSRTPVAAIEPRVTGRAFLDTATRACAVADSGTSRTRSTPPSGAFPDARIRTSRLDRPGAPVIESSLCQGGSLNGSRARQVGRCRRLS